MKYLFLTYLDEQNWEALSSEEQQREMAKCQPHVERLAASGKLLDGAPLHSTTRAITIWVRGGKQLVTDGPFAETREQIGGYTLVGGREPGGGHRSEPDWTRLPSGTPPSIQRLLRRALKKDPGQRLGDIRDARLEIEEALNEPIERPTKRSRRKRREWCANNKVANRYSQSNSGCRVGILPAVRRDASLGSVDDFLPFGFQSETLNPVVQLSLSICWPDTASIDRMSRRCFSEPPSRKYSSFRTMTYSGGAISNECSRG